MEAAAMRRVATGPPGLPLLGHAPAFLSDRLGFLLASAARYGEVVKLKIGTTVYLLNDPEDVGHVLVHNARNYDKTPRLTSWRGRRLSGAGLLTSSGDQHLQLRRMLQPMFHPRSIAVCAGTIVDTARETLDRWSDGMECDVAAEMMALVHRVMGRTLLSVDFAGESKELGDAIVLRRRYIRYIFASLLPFPEYLPAPVVVRYRGAIRRIDRALYRMIESRRGTEAPPEDMLSMLVRIRARDGAALSDKQVRDEALTLSITGYETIGEALAWTWYLLSRHPEVERRLRQELEDVLHDRLPSLDDLPRLRYTGMVLEESMRLYPPTWIFLRVARDADVLPSGVTIPAGAKLYLSPYVMHRNPRFFPEPERFDPERFTPGAKPARPKLAYLPFGAGPRLCIGEPLARMQGVLLLAAVAQRFELTLLPGQTIVPHPGVTLSPRHGIRMRLTRRMPSGSPRPH